MFISSNKIRRTCITINYYTPVGKTPCLWCWIMRICAPPATSLRISMPFPGCSSCSKIAFLWELLALHSIIIKSCFILFEYIKNFPPAQSVLTALQLLQRAKRTHTNLLFVIRYYLTHTGLKISNNICKILSFTFLPLLGEGEGGWQRKIWSKCIQDGFFSFVRLK